MAVVTRPTPSARAYEDQVTIGADLGYAARFSDSGTGHGAVFGFLSSVGLDDTWTARGGLSYAIEPASAPVHSFLLSADLIYLVDVLELVPYAGAGIDGIGTLIGSQFDTDLGAHAALGIDYLCSRSFAVGLGVRPILVLSRLDSSPFLLFANTTFSFIFDL